MDNSPFGPLSPEIRNEIWKFAITFENPLHLLDPEEPVQPNITRVCRQIRDESLHQFYSINNFFLEVVVPFWGSYPWPTPRMEKSLQRLVYWLSTVDHAVLGSLQSLEIVAITRHMTSPDNASLLKYMDISYKLGADHGGRGYTKPELHVKLPRPADICIDGYDNERLDQTFSNLAAGLCKYFSKLGLETNLVVDKSQDQPNSAMVVER